MIELNLDRGAIIAISIALSFTFDHFEQKNNMSFDNRTACFSELPRLHTIDPSIHVRFMHSC